MAEQLVLVRANDFVSDVDSLDLFGNTAGIIVERGGWVPKVGVEGVVTEVLTLTVKGTTHDTLAAYLQGLELKLRQISDYMQSSVEKTGVWLRDQAAGETYARQALCTGGWTVQLSNSFHTPTYLMEQYRLGIDRSALWELAGASMSTITVTEINCVTGNIAPEE